MLVLVVLIVRVVAYPLQKQQWVGDACFGEKERYEQRKGAEMELLRQEGRATVVRRLRSLLGLGLGHPPLVEVIAADGTKQLVPRRPPDDLGGMLGLERRPVTPPTPPHYTPRLGRGHRAGDQGLPPEEIKVEGASEQEEPAQPGKKA